MAISKNGINGSFSGKVGTVIGYEVGGQNIIRMVGKRRKAFSEGELLNQAKMRAVSLFMADIGPYFRVGYESLVKKGQKIGAYQLAQSHVRKEAVVLNEAGEPVIDPAKVLIFRGGTPSPEQVHVERAGQDLFIQWSNQKSLPDVYCVVLLYSEKKGWSSFRNIGAFADLREDHWIGAIPAVIQDPVYVYVAFRNADTAEFSNSVYAGTV